MAKKLVKYAFGNHEKYASLKKRGQYTVYFVYDTVEDPITHKQVPGPYGTIYKGDTRIGTSRACDLVFDKELKVCLLEGATEADSKYYTIEAGTSLADFAAAVLKQGITWDQEMYADLVGYEGDDENPGNLGIIRSIISDECAFDEDSNAAGIIAEAINTRLAASISDGPGGTIKAFLDSSYMSKEDVGKLGELADAFKDEDTLDKIIKAASGISEVLSGYYTQEEAEALLKDIIILPTYEKFPEVGDSTKLYVDAEENLMYRWGIDSDSSVAVNEYIPVGGSAGGGGNTSVETKMFIKDSKTTVSIAKDTDYVIEYIFSSANTYTTYNKKTGTFNKVQQQTGSSASVTYSIDGVKFDSGLCAQSSYDETAPSKNVYNSYRIPASRFTGTQHKIKIEATSLSSNETAVQEITINIVNVTINSTYNAAPASLAAPITVPVTVSSTNSVEVFYKVDDDDAILGTTIANGSGTMNIEVSNTDMNGDDRAPGAHKLSIWAVTTVGGNTLTTSSLDYIVLWYDPTSSAPIVSFSCLDDLDPVTQKYVATQYEYSKFRYQVYPGRGNDTADIQLIASRLNASTGRYEETIVNSLAVDKNVRNWSYIFDNDGKYQIYVKVLYTEDGDEKYLIGDKVDITVNKSEFAMDAVPGAVMYMTAKDHDNNGEHTWVDTVNPELKAFLTNFAWTDNSGWYNDAANATTSLRVANGAKCTIPFTPFAANYAETGMTLEFDFSTSKLSNSETTIITCHSPLTDNQGIQGHGTGIIITATGAYWETGEYKKSDINDTRIYVPFKENERVRVSFVMTPMGSDDIGSATHEVDIWNITNKKYETIETVSQGWWRFFKVYINGICVSINSYTGDGGISQGTLSPSNIVIGSSDATVDVYNIRFYEKALYDKEIVANYIADTQNPVEKVKIFKRNNILNPVDNTIAYSKLISKIPCLFITCVSSSTYAGFTNDAHILPMSKADKRGFNVVFNCEQLDDEAKANYPWAKSFVAYNAQMQVQGTSSQYYPRKNYKLKFKTPKSASVAYEDAIATKKPTFLFVGTTGNAYDSTMDVNTFIKNNCENPNNAEYWKKKYQLRQYPKELEGKSVEHINSVAATNFCLKADFMESSSTHNTGMAKFVDFLSKNMSENYAPLTPPQWAQYNASTRSGKDKMIDVTIRTCIDGYPIVIFWRKTYDDDYTFLGKYNFNIDKGAENVFGFIDNIEGLINPYTGYNFQTFDEDYYDNASTADRQAYMSPVECWEFTNNSTGLCKFTGVTEDSFRVSSKLNSNVAEWTESFEARHPDNDMLAADYASKVKIPTNFEALCQWISSTDRTGLVGDKKVAITWTGTYEAFIAGGQASVSTFDLNERLDTLNADKSTASNKALEYWKPELNYTYILAPYTLDPYNNDKVPSTEYTYYGYTVTYDEEKNEWVLGEKFIEPITEVDKSAYYYIAKEGTSFSGKVIRYDETSINESTGEYGNWVEYASIEDYRLPAPKVYGNITYTYDTAEYRLDKFKYELEEHMNLNATTFYYIMTEFFAQVDQRAKNLMFATWGYEPGAANVKPASAFPNVEAAKAAGYKPVYSYQLSKVAAASTPMVYGATPKSVVINEVDCDGKQIELYNTTGESISLVGWKIRKTDEDGINTGKNLWTIPESEHVSTTINAHDRVVYKNTGKDKTLTEAEKAIRGFLFGISSSKQWNIELLDENDVVIDTISNNKTGFDLTIDSSAFVDQGYIYNPGNVIARETDGSDIIIGVEGARTTIGAPNNFTIAPASVQTPLPIYKTYTCEVSEFSGICLKGETVADGFYAVSDGGKLYDVSTNGITEIELANVSKDVKFIGKNVDGTYSYIPYKGDIEIRADFDTSIVPNTDFEAITKDANGDVYIMADCRGNNGYTVSLYIYKLVENDGVYSLETVTTADTAKSFEGFTFKEGTTFLLGCKTKEDNSFAPGIYTIDLGTVVEGTPTAITKVTDDTFNELTTEVADIHFDGNNIWIIDSKEKTVCKLSAEYEFIEKFALTFAEVNPEAMLVDPTAQEMWIGCDNGNAKSQITNLIQISLDGHLLGTSPVVVNECDPDNKWLELYNTTEDAIDLQGYRLVKDNEEATAFTFQNSTILPAKGRIVLTVKNNGVDGPTFGMSATKGFDYKLYDNTGKLIEHFDNLTVIKQVPDGCTIGRKTDGAKEIVIFKYHGTIGKSNNEGVLNSGIYINAIDAGGNNIGKRFEIYNSTSEAYSLVGHTFIKDTSEWKVVDTAEGEGTCLTTSTTPATEEGQAPTVEHITIDCSLGLSNMVIPAGGYVVVQCNNTKPNKVKDGETAMDNTKWPDFGISDTKGFELAIKDASDVLIDKVDNSLANNPNYVSAAFYGRVTDGADDFVKFTEDPIGVSNNTVASEPRIAPTRADESTIYINEIHPAEDLVELYNAGDEDVALGTFILSKNFDSLDRWSFPADATIAAHGFYTVRLKQYDETIGPRFGISTSDFILVLSNGATITADAVDNRVAAPNAVTIPAGMSWGRIEDGGDTWDFYSTPSIGASNATGTIYVPEVLDFAPGEILNHLVINEIQGATGFKLIEIYNPTNSAIDLGNKYALVKEDADGYVNDGVDCDYWIYPAGARIEAKGHYVSAAGGNTYNGVAGATFGISLRQGKNFKLRLMQVTNSTDYTTLDSILATATQVDICDNTVKAAYVAEKESLETFGRINDGSENWALFQAPGTIGTSNNAGTPIALPKSEEENTEHSVATVLYYVPEKCNYIYYPIFYDNDTMLSVNNTGYMIYKPNIESTDKVGSGYAYNGTESTLWLNFKDAFADHIRNIYDIMRKDAGLNYANITHFFNDTQSDMWAENVYNMDAKFKYVDPATIGYTDFSIAAETVDSSSNTVAVQGANVRDSYYLYECQGSRKSHRSWWLNNRFTYMDSRYYIDHGSTDYALCAVFRLYTPAKGAYNPAYPADSTFHIIPYTDMYLRIKFGAKDVGVRAEKNKVYDVSTGDPTDKFNDTETMVFGAPYILSYGDLTGKYVRLADTGPSSRITDLKLGEAAPYYNDNLVNLAFNTANTSLKHIDVRNCKNLSKLDGLNELTSLTTLRATNTSVSTFNFNETGVALTTVDFPKTLSALVLKNMPYLKHDGMSFESFANITKVVIEKCPLLESTSFTLIRSILAASPKMTNLRISGINWNIETQDEFNDWKKIVKLNAVSETGLDNSVMGIPYISGTVNLNDRIISTGYRAGLTADMLNKTGANLKIIGGHEISLNGISISGPAVITPNVEYTYSIEYGPDNYVLDSEKGVTWSVSAGLTIVEETRDSIKVKFAGSASGTEAFNIAAVSTANSTYKSDISVRPTATLSSIRVYDMQGNEINYSSPTLVYENSSVSFEIRFNPSDTLDTAISIAVVNAEAFVKDNGKPYSYSSNDHRLTFRGAEVSQQQSAIVSIKSVNLPSVGVSFPIIVNNVVSRIITLQDATRNGVRVKGYVDVKVDGVNSARDFRVFSDDNGVITLPTNVDNIDKFDELYENDKSVIAAFGFRGITVTPHAIDEDKKEFLYNAPEPIYFPPLPDSADSDVEQVVSFYSPVTCKITVMNNGNIVHDANLKIKSLENASTRFDVMGSEAFTEYNNVMIRPYDGTGIATNPASIKLLANTAHNIEIVETDDLGITLPNGNKYSKYTGVIKTGTNTGGASAEMNVVINISRDYLGNIQDVKNTELHMTVLTGLNTCTTVRLYYRVIGDIIINWGDSDENSHYSDTISGDLADNTEHAIYHQYNSADREYDISIVSNANSNTQNIKWFHVMSEKDTYMKPCFGTGTNDSGFSTSWNNQTTGGLVAYQCCGAADFDKMPSFRFEREADKAYSKLLCVGDIYQSCTKSNMKNADYLFANTTLEQIPSTAMFSKCKQIETFNFTFLNTNLTEFPASFFTSNPNAVEFTSTFEGCGRLGAIKTDPRAPFLLPGAGVEIRSVKNMFKGCSSIVSEVPEFWKTFYGCSFAKSEKAQSTFAGCVFAANYSKVPASWGGYPATPEFKYSANNINLVYVKMGTDNGFGCFSLNNIYLKPNYRYLLDLGFNPSYHPHPGNPIFGAAHTTNPTSASFGLNEIDRVIDFTINGNTDGSNPGIDTGYFLYRLGDLGSLNSWYAAQGATGNAKVFGKPDSYQNGLGLADAPENNVPNLYKRVLIDICHREANKVQIAEYDGVENAEDLAMTHSVMANEWKRDLDTDTTLVEWNVPLRILSSYQVNTYDAISGGNRGATPNEYVPEPMSSYKFYGLRIYDAQNVLIHDIRPQYGIVDGVACAFLKDLINPSSAYRPSGTAADNMEYYKENINETYE